MDFARLGRLLASSRGIEINNSANTCDGYVARSDIEGGNVALLSVCGLLNRESDRRYLAFRWQVTAAGIGTAATNSVAGTLAAEEA